MFIEPSIVLSGARTYRRSSWDRSGRNHDWVSLYPDKTVTLFEATGPGKVTHFYWTTANAGRYQFRQLVLRAWWDGEATPSVEVPLGDLFLVPHGTPVLVHSLGAVVNLGCRDLVTWGLNLYLPMPFATSARMELTYEAIQGVPADPMVFWYHIEAEQYSQPLAANEGRFHAQWRRENPTTPKAGTDANSPMWNGVNLDAKENYVALEAEGAGQMVGLHLQVDNLGGGWYGEGDDMVFVDGRPGAMWPPTYPGTGTEEIFGGGACPDRAYSGPYTGFHMVEHPDFSRKNAMYRWYLADPIRFERSLVWTIEHGHDDCFGNDYTSVAYWYQIEPHGAFPKLPDARARLPRFPDVMLQAEAARVAARGRMDNLARAGANQEVMPQVGAVYNQGCRALFAGQPEEALRLFESIR